MTSYKYQKFNLSEKNINKFLNSIETNQPSNFYLSKKTMQETPAKGSVKLLLYPKECGHVQNKKPFTYQLTKDKISNMQKKTKNGGVLPIVIPAIISAIGALGGLAAGTASVVSAVNQRKTDKEKNEIMEHVENEKNKIQKDHNHEIENILRSGKGLILNSGSGLYLTKYGDGLILTTERI